MKIFDEVTKALSICGRHPDCKGCPYENVSYPTEIGNTCKDIMHYDALYYMQDRIDECQEANPPLTWDELKTMEGKPVWVEVLDDTGDHYKWRGDGWYIVKDFSQGYYGGYCHLEPNYRTWTEKTYSDLWQAYRKERENGQS